MEFKVGDKVKLIKKTNSTNGFEIGQIYTITSANNMGLHKIEIFNNEFTGYCDKDCLKLVEREYTFEDFKNAPIGTKVTFENGEVLIKTDNDRFENGARYRTYRDLENFKDNSIIINLGKITKIEKPVEYKTVYEAKQEILDEKEKEYLSNIIRPFRNKEITIFKKEYCDSEKCFIEIFISNPKPYSEYDRIRLPDFSNRIMYKGMKTNKRYSLKELGL